MEARGRSGDVARGDGAERDRGGGSRRIGRGTRKGVDWLLGTAGNESEMYKRVILRIGRVLGNGGGSTRLQREGMAVEGRIRLPGWSRPRTHWWLCGKRGKRKSWTAARCGSGCGWAKACCWTCAPPTADGITATGPHEGKTCGRIRRRRRSRCLGCRARERLWAASIDLAKKMLGETTSPLAKAWLTIAMRCMGSRWRS